MDVNCPKGGRHGVKWWNSGQPFPEDWAEGYNCPKCRMDFDQEIIAALANAAMQLTAEEADAITPDFPENFDRLDAYAEAWPK